MTESEAIIRALSTDTVVARPVVESDEIGPLVPAHWLDILGDPTPRNRIEAALAHWGPDIRRLVPTFFENLARKIQDVTVLILEIDNTQFPILAYCCGENSSGFPVLWIGRTPSRPSGDLPKAIEPLQSFFTETHSEFTAEDWLSNGILPPEQFDELRSESRIADGEEFHLADGRTINTDDVLVTAKYSGALFLCLLPTTGEGILEYEGNFDTARPYFSHLDRLMTQAWDA